MGTKLLKISILFLIVICNNIKSQITIDSLQYDSIQTETININGLFLNDSKHKLEEIIGMPDLCTEVLSEYDESKYFLCSIKNKASFVLNENNNIKDVEYFMLENHTFYFDNKPFRVNDSIELLSIAFPNSYQKFRNQNGNIFYLIGINKDRARTGINVQIIIKNGRIFSFSINTEQ